MTFHRLIASPLGHLGRCGTLREPMSIYDQVELPESTAKFREEFRAATFGTIYRSGKRS